MYLILKMAKRHIFYGCNCSYRILTNDPEILTSRSYVFSSYLNGNFIFVSGCLGLNILFFGDLLSKFF